MNAINIAASGLQASAARLGASASNLANVNTVGAASGAAGQNGSVYQPVEIRQSALPGGGVATLAGLRRPASFPRYDPSSSAADTAGMVASPNVDLVTETVDQMVAARAYQANLAVIRAADSMQSTLLDRTA